MMSQTMMSREVYVNCRFYVKIGNKEQGVFTEVSGLQAETNIEEYQEGGHNGFTHQLPGRTTISRITLKRGMVASNDLFAWYLKIMRGEIERRNVSIEMYDSTGSKVMHWEFAEAFPMKWVGPQFTADGQTAAVETLELAHAGLIP